jgi:hypothetical protein
VKGGAFGTAENIVPKIGAEIQVVESLAGNQIRRVVGLSGADLKVACSRYLDLASQRQSGNIRCFVVELHEEGQLEVADAIGSRAPFWADVGIENGLDEELQPVGDSILDLHRYIGFGSLLGVLVLDGRFKLELPLLQKAGALGFKG